MSFLKPRPEPAKEVVTLYGGPKDGEQMAVKPSDDLVFYPVHTPLGYAAVYERSASRPHEFFFVGTKPISQCP